MRRTSAPFLIVMALLAACSTPVSSSPTPSSTSLAPPTLAPVIPSGAAATPEPTPAQSFPALPGLTFDAALAWAEGFSLTCQTGLFPPNRSDQLVIALCQRQSAKDNAQVDLTIQYWPNDTVLAASAATKPINGDSVSADFHVAWLHWMAGLPYAGADANATLDWLLSDADCSAGCSKSFGGVSWSHSVGGNVEAVSAFVVGE